jgi:hypothetical protein
VYFNLQFILTTSTTHRLDFLWNFYGIENSSKETLSPFSHIKIAKEKA